MRGLRVHFCLSNLEPGCLCRLICRHCHLLIHLRPIPAAFVRLRLRLATISNFQRGDCAPAMNTSGVMSPPSIHVSDMNGMSGRRRSSSRTAGEPFSRSPGPMAVPNARAGERCVPPPLPPPRHIEELAAGSDPGWKWGNTPYHGGFGGNSSSSLSSSSSLRGSWDQRMGDEHILGRPEHSRRGSSGTTIKSPPGVDRKYDFSRNIDEGYHSLSGSSISNYRLVENRFHFPALTFLCSPCNSWAASFFKPQIPFRYIYGHSSVIPQNIRRSLENGIRLYVH